MFRSSQSAEASTDTYINNSGEAVEVFKTHKQLARRFTWHQKLFMASRVALAVAVVGLLIYVLFAERLLLQLSPLAFLLALLIPNRNGTERALEHIDADIGLSYRTALEYQNSSSDLKSELEQVDFSGLLLKRAAYRVRNLELPDLQPWWLPMLVTSIVLSLVPFFLNATPLNFGGRGLLGNNNFQRPANNQPPPQEPLPEEQASTEDEAFEEQAAEDASDLNAQDQDDADLESSFEDSSQQPDRNVSEAEGETLSRFLDNLKEKPQAEEENVAQQDRQNRQSSDDASDNEAENAEDAETERREQAGEESSRENGDSEEGSESGEEQSSERNEEGQQQASGENEEGQEEGEEAAANRDGENDGEEGAQEGAQPDVGGRQEGEDEAGFGSEDNENGIGNGASEATPRSEERLEGQMQSPELLEGQVLSDDSTIAGEVRLPGSDQGEIPGGSSAQEFDRAVERAIAEGRIPVEYQEILKNYFR